MTLYDIYCGISGITKGLKFKNVDVTYSYASGVMMKFVYVKPLGAPDSEFNFYFATSKVMVELAIKTLIPKIVNGVPINGFDTKTTLIEVAAPDYSCSVVSRAVDNYRSSCLFMIMLVDFPSMVLMETK